MMKYPLLKKLTKNDLFYISKNVDYTKHALLRAKERFPYDKYKSIASAIRKSDFAFVNTDGTVSVSIAGSGGKSIKLNQNNNDTFTVITIYDRNLNNKDIRKRYRLALRGYGRGH